MGEHYHELEDWEIFRKIRVLGILLLEYKQSLIINIVGIMEIEGGKKGTPIKKMHMRKAE